jgi:plasmid stabilization system protein ParE
LLVEAAVQEIANFPFRFRVLHPPFRRRLVQKFPYGLIYTIEPDHIHIFAVAHTKRRPGYWLSRTEDES